MVVDAGQKQIVGELDVNLHLAERLLVAAEDGTAIAHQQ
jgi:hypothetical protein